MLLAGLAVWVGAVGAGMTWLWTYANTPGPPAQASPRWPAQTTVERHRTRPTLVVFLHPDCGCSTATVSELALLMAHARDNVRVKVLIFRPRESPPGWDQSGSLWQQAREIPGVDVEADVDAAEAARFGVYVSGQTLLYDRSGELAFAGGITYARGHEGANDGRLALTALLTGSRPERRRTPVFGCLLRPVQSA